MTNGAAARTLCAAMTAMLFACASRAPQQQAGATPPPPVPPQAPEPETKADPKISFGKTELRELFPHVRADVSARLVEFDGTVPIDTHDQRTPRVYLEVTVCTPDTKEHETLVVTPARPSHIHAALLAAGFQPGTPGSWKWDGRKITAIPPKGHALEITIAYHDASGREIETPATQWVINAETGARFGGAAGSRFVFAGSAMVKRQGREVYDADGSGLLVGLTTFGSESIAWSEVISPEAEMTEPEWIADAKVVPRMGTAVVVRIRPSGAGR